MMAAIVMASLSGSAVADTAALASVLVPMMRKAGYDVNRSCGLIACGGIIAPVIPPSIGFILFGVTGGVFITKLFIAGIVPGADGPRHHDRLALVHQARQDEGRAQVPPSSSASRRRATRRGRWCCRS